MQRRAQPRPDHEEWRKKAEQDLLDMQSMLQRKYVYSIISIILIFCNSRAQVAQDYERRKREFKSPAVCLLRNGFV